MSDFDYFTREYAEALAAFQAIEKRAPELIAYGGADDLRNFLQQFIAMGTRARDEAVEKEEPNFAAWFRELVEKAQALRDSIES